MKFIAEQNNLRFEIEEDLPEVGFYLYVFDENNKCIRDYLQDSKDMAMEFALEEFSVPLNSWIVQEDQN